MRLTVAICTWNRADLLARTLESLASLDVPPRCDWQVIIVNNNCTDHTDQVVRRHADRLPITAAFESAPGLASARNCAIAHATGEYILWTDDDVLVAGDWLSAYASAFTRHPEAAFFGGPIEPWFAEPPAAWLRRLWPQVEGLYAVRDLGPSEQVLTGDQLPYGANLVVRSDVQRRFPYDPALGHCAGRLVGGEETDVLGKILAAGHCGYWIPDARVKHYIARDRLTLSYLRVRYRGLGEHLALAEETIPGRTLFGCPPWLWKRAAAAYCDYLRRRVSGDVESWFDSFARAQMAIGGLRGTAARNRREQTAR